MFVQTDANGVIEAYHSDISDDDYFYVVGYWSNVTFTEGFSGSITPAGSGAWENYTTDAASQVHHVILANYEADVANTLGARTNGSSLERKLLVHEPEAGGYSLLDLLVKSDASSTIEIYSSDRLNAFFFFFGYFNSAMDFVEKWQEIMGAAGAWTELDISAYLDVDGRMVDCMLMHKNEGSLPIMGIRGGDDTTTDRSLTEHEAESAGAGGEYSGFSMSAQSNSSVIVKGRISSGSSPWVLIYLTGYFKPASSASVANSPSSKAFGVVAASSTYYAYGSAPSNPVTDGE